MRTATPPTLSDPTRLAALREARLLDTPPEEAFDRLAQLARRLFRVPVAAVSLVDADRQFLKSQVGLGEPWASRREIPLSHSLCKYVVMSGEPLVLHDTRKVRRLRGNGAVRELRALAYAGFPLRAPDGLTLGAVCLMDHQPRAWTAEEMGALSDLAITVESYVQMRGQALGATPSTPRDRWLRSLIENSQTLYHIVGADGRILYMSPAAEAMLGYEPEELVGRHAAELVHPDEREALQASFEDAMRNPGGVHQMEARVAHRDGSWCMLQVTGKTIQDDTGAMLALVSSRDITQRKAAEDALRKSEERYRLVARATNEVIWDLDIVTGRITWNEVGPRMFRFAPTEVGSGIDWHYERIHPEDRERVVRGTQAAMAGIGDAWSAEYRFLRGDGAYATVLDRGYVVRDEKAEPVRMVGSMLDLTERKRAEDAQRLLARTSALLEESLDYPTTLANVARMAVPEMADYCLIDELGEDGEIHRVATAHADRAREALLLRDEHLPLDSDPDHHPALRVIRTGHSVLVPDFDDAALARIAHDAEHRERLRELGLRSYMVVPMAARGRTLGAITLAAAESGRHYAPSDLIVAEEVARRAALAVDNARLYRAAQAAVRARDEVLAVVSHDLRNPLSAVGMGVSMMFRADRERSPFDTRTLEMIGRSAEQMNVLIQDLLDVSKMEAGHFAVDTVPHLPATLLDEACELLSPISVAKGIRLERRDAGGVPAVRADRDRILQLFSNLVGNAVKFTPSGGEVTLGAEVVEGGVRFTVADTGVGIAPETLPHVWDRFWQARGADRRGAGLGLAIARGIVEAHGGSIGVTNRPEGGAEFAFVVPVAEPEPAAP